MSAQFSSATPRTPGPAESNFAEVLYHYRLRAGLTQEILAAQAGVRPAAIAALEKGLRRSPVTAHAHSTGDGAQAVGGRSSGTRNRGPLAAAQS